MSPSAGARSASIPRAMVSSWRSVVVGRALQRIISSVSTARGPSRATSRSVTSCERSHRIASTSSIRVERAPCSRAVCAAIACASSTIRGRFAVEANAGNASV